MNASATEGLDQRWSDLLFSVRRSVRYHERRQAYFSMLHRANSCLNVLLATAAAAAIGDMLNLAEPLNHVFVVGAFLIAALNAVDVVYGFSDRSNTHADLRRRFIQIEKCMAGAASDEQLQKCIVDRLEIEGNEPPKMHALDLLCHNELLVALGYDRKAQAHEFWKVPLYMGMTANLWQWSGRSFERMAAIPPEEERTNSSLAQ